MHYLLISSPMVNQVLFDFHCSENYISLNQLTRASLALLASSPSPFLPTDYSLYSISTVKNGSGGVISKHAPPDSLFQKPQVCKTSVETSHQQKMLHL